MSTIIAKGRFFDLCSPKESDQWAVSEFWGGRKTLEQKKCSEVEFAKNDKARPQLLLQLSWVGGIWEQKEDKDLCQNLLSFKENDCYLFFRDCVKVTIAFYDHNHN